MKKALIFGILGQDGSYMAELLTSKNYMIFGVVRENADLNKINFIKLLIPNINIIYINVLNKNKIFETINNVKPNEIYNFASVSDVFNPWENLDLIFNTNAMLPQNILEAIIKIDKKIKFFQASSSLIFGRDASGYQNEETPSNPIHPYGIAKLYADNMIKEFRYKFGLYCCSGIFFNHSSSRLKDGFFSKKITSSVINIKNGKQNKICVGNILSQRDHGYAPDFMKAVYLMMNNSEPKDYVIGTGKLTSMEEFMKKCFEYVNLDYKKYIEISDNLIRLNDTNILRANISNINKDLNWLPEHSVDEMIEFMINDGLKV